jgi:segregation and condensation protein B
MAQEVKKESIVEALIFASDTPISAARIKDVTQDMTPGQVKKAVEKLNSKYEKEGSSFLIVEVAGGYQMVTRETFAPFLAELYKSRSASRLTQKGLETLAIIAYKQPITKQEMESIRGVNVDGVVKTLLERNMITIVGRQKAPGNPLLYGTTKAFLEYFGLLSLESLPKLKEIDELLKDDEKFLESLDQVALEQLAPEVLGLKNILDKKEQTEAAAESTPEETNSNNPDGAATESSADSASEPVEREDPATEEPETEAVAEETNEPEDEANTPDEKDDTEEDNESKTE